MRFEKEVTSHVQRRVTTHPRPPSPCRGSSSEEARCTSATTWASLQTYLHSVADVAVVADIVVVVVSAVGGDAVVLDGVRRVASAPLLLK